MEPHRRHGFPSGPRLAASLALALAVGLTALVTIPSGRPVRSTRASEAQAAQPRSPTLTIGWVGDITPGSSHGTLPGDARSLFADVRRLTREPDLMIGNLEGTLSIGGAGKCPAGSAGRGTCFAFQAPPTAARGLRSAGFDVVNLANNHSFDFGAQGLGQTVTALERSGVAWTGLPGRAAVVGRRGLVIAVLGFAPYRWANHLLDHAGAARQVSRAARAADLVVVTAHIGAEGAAAARTPAGPEAHLGEPRGDSRAFARAVIDAGADLVLASGAHVLRGLELYRGRLIAHGMGNFAGVNNFSTGGDLALSGLLSTRLERHGAMRNAWLHGLRLDGSGHPSPDRERTAVRFVATRSREDFPRSPLRVLPTGRVLARRAPPR